MFQTSATQSTKGRPRMPPRKDFRDCGNRRDDNACQKPRPSRWAKIQARPLYPLSITRPPVVGPLMASGSTKSVRTFSRCQPEEAESFATRKDPDEDYAFRTMAAPKPARSGDALSCWIEPRLQVEDGAECTGLSFAQDDSLLATTRCAHYTSARPDRRSMDRPHHHTGWPSRGIADAHE